MVINNIYGLLVVIIVLLLIAPKSKVNAITSFLKQFNILSGFSLFKNQGLTEESKKESNNTPEA